MFRGLGLAALLLGLGFLAFFFATLIGNSYTAVQQTRVQLDVRVRPRGHRSATATRDARDAAYRGLPSAWRATRSARCFPR